jgi:hypothetical protein
LKRRQLPIKTLRLERGLRGWLIALIVLRCDPLAVALTAAVLAGRSTAA